MARAVSELRAGERPNAFLGGMRLWQAPLSDTEANTLPPHGREQSCHAHFRPFPHPALARRATIDYRQLTILASVSIRARARGEVHVRCFVWRNCGFNPRPVIAHGAT